MIYSNVWNTDHYMNSRTITVLFNGKTGCRFFHLVIYFTTESLILQSHYICRFSWEYNQKMKQLIINMQFIVNLNKLLQKKIDTKRLKLTPGYEVLIKNIISLFWRSQFASSMTYSLDHIVSKGLAVSNTSQEL